MTSLRPYPAYKDSGVEWIGQVPAHWSLLRLANIGPLMKANGGNKEDDAEAGVPCIRYGDLYTTYDDVIRNITKFISPEAAANYTAIRRGDALFAASGETFEEIGMSSVNLSHTEAVCGGDVIVLRPHKTIDPVFLAYAAGSSSAQAQKSQMGKGFTVIHVYGDQLRNLVIAAPPEQEQPLIGAAIEREAARIDALITKKTRFIELLKEKRQALITHAVTKGLDPKAKMRDSGVEWIGDVPDHWKISKLAYETREQGGKTPSTENEDYWGGDIPWVCPKDMKRDVISDSIDKITVTAVHECGMAFIPENAVLAVVRGMILAHSFPVAEISAPVTLNQDMKALVPNKKLLAPYLRMLLQSAKSYVVSVLVAEAAHGTRVLRTDIWRQLPVLLPPIDEQQQIVNRVAKIIKTFDRTLALTQRSIDLLKERRSAFITAAVTGQIDLRGSL